MRERDKPEGRLTKKASLTKLKRTLPMQSRADNLSPARLDSKLNIIADLSTLAGKNRDLSPEEAGKLIHTLQAHQIELEIQNEELRRFQAELEESRNKYFEFYDLAPISYFSFDRHGVILEANLAAAKLLGEGKSNLIGKPFYVFLEGPETIRFITHLREVFNSNGWDSAEMWINTKKGAEYYAHIESRSMTSSKGDRICRTSIIDITEREKAEKLLTESEETLKEQKAALEQKNMALKEMIEQINIEKNRIKEDIALNIEFTLMPVISKLKISEDSESLIDLLKYHLNEIASSFGHKITQKSCRLTPRESEICCMIKGGLTSKEICNLLNVSNLTIAKHRRNIRKKLGLSNKKINLTSFLNGL